MSVARLAVDVAEIVEVFGEEDPLLRSMRIGRINVVCDRISTKVKLSPGQKRSYGSSL
jgi:hypothetical protein